MVYLMTEVWRAIPGYEGSYEASDRGRVRSLDRYIDMPCVPGHCRAHRHLCRGRVLKPGLKPSGHMSVMLGRAGGSQDVHVLVLLTFRGPPQPDQEARHLNGFPAYNRLSNLEWASRSRNGQDKKYHNGSRNYKLMPRQVRQIKHALLKPEYGLQSALARRYAVSVNMISNIKYNRAHRDVCV